jgi:hypothetical protein
MKPVTEFNWRWKSLGKRQRTCRDCQKIQKNDWYEKNKETHKSNVYNRKADRKEAARQYVWEYLSTHPCVDCGENDPIILEFDHVSGIKKYTISDLVMMGYSLKTIKAEIRKCQVRCRNCHVRKTHKEQGSWRDQY